MSSDMKATIQFYDIVCFSANLFVSLASVAVLVALYIFKKKREPFVVWSLILLFVQGILCAYNGFYITFILSDEEYNERMGDLRVSNISEPVHGVGNVILALFHWVFAL